MLSIRAVDLVVIGGGPAGMAAALAAAEAGVEEIVLLERQESLGGILPQCIHNGFGLRYFKEELTGPEYAHRFMLELEKHSGIKVKTATMVVQVTADRQVVTTSAAEGLVCYQARAVILAMGCRERPRGAINIPGTRPAGIYTAGSLQYLMNIEGFLPGRTAVILGSGDIGIRARFPERNALLHVGRGRVKRRIVSPGETIYYTVKPEDIDESAGYIGVSLEGGEGDD